MERRDFLASAASVIFVPSTRSSPYLDENYVTTLAESLGRSRYELGGIALVPAALGHLRHIGQSMGQSRPKSLQRATSQLADQTTLILYDAGQLTHAEQSARMALEFARRGDDLQGQGRAYDALSRLSQDRGDYARGVIYAQRGLRLPDLANAQKASLSMRLGRSLALVPAQQKMSRDVLDQALSVGGISPFAEAALLGDVAIGLGHLGIYETAETMLSDAVEAIGRWSPLFRAQYLGRQVEIALRGASLDLAVERMHALARAIPFVNSARVNKRAADILGSSLKWDATPEIRQAREHIRTMLPPDQPLL
ncbi:hypothetical protein J5X84_23105 [Streptosporangiaceae bacterium NEAU-GS5]|nr:hypothetical protein [Streptosporangiaceae bacterium NEAU-GS5]